MLINLSDFNEAQTFFDVILKLIDALLDYRAECTQEEQGKIQKVLDIIFVWADKDFDNRVEAVKRKLDAR